MSVYIPGISMPKTCYDNCPCQGIHWCNPLNEITEPMTGKRLDNCPLVNVPPHGRLIDADKLDYSNTDLLGNHIVYMVDIEDAPTIIPAEEGDG